MLDHTDRVEIRGRVSLQTGKLLQPQYSEPARKPRRVVRFTIRRWQEGQWGVLSALRSVPGARTDRVTRRAIRRTNSRSTIAPQPQRMTTGPAFQMRAWINWSTCAFAISTFAANFVPRAFGGMGLALVHLTIARPRPEGGTKIDMMSSRKHRGLPPFSSPARAFASFAAN